MRAIEVKIRRMMTVSVLLLAACCLPGAVYGANPHQEAAAGSSLHIMLSLSLAGAGGNPVMMNFGEVFTGGVPNTVTLSTLGERAAGVAGTLGNDAGVIVPAFTVTGDHSASLDIILPETVTISNGLATMTVAGFTHNLGATPALDANGNALFSVGATLNVGAGQPTGQYTGSFVIAVAYQ